MSFPIPYKRLRFIGFGEFKGTKTSTAAAPLNNNIKKCPVRRFRLILSCLVYITGTSGFDTDVTVFFVDFTNRYLVKRANVTVASYFNPPMGDANVTVDESQAYPIPWFADEWLWIATTAGGAGKEVTHTWDIRFMEWEIL